jgi:hypothetical protein
MEGYLQAISEHLCRGHYTIRELNSVINSYNDLGPAWELIKSPLADPSCPSYVLNLKDSMLSCWNECNTLIRIMTVFMPDSEELVYINQFVNNWESNLMVSVRKVLLLEQPPKWNVPTKLFTEHFGADYLLDKLACRSLSELLVNGIDWLVKAEASEFFKAFWHNNKGSRVESLLSILPKWHQLLVEILDESVSFEMLDMYGDTVLCGDREASLFVATAGGLSFLDDGSFSFGLLNIDSSVSTTGHHYRFNEVESAVNKCVFQWKHIRDFYFNADHVSKVLVAARAHLDDSEHHHLNAAEVALYNLCTDVKKRGPWKEQKFFSAKVYWSHAKTLDIRLLDISYKLMLCVQEHAELINWLRGISDDENFMSSLDIARSLQEMNAPIELWDSKAGRINEKYLSMISNIRDYFYSYLYAAEYKVSSFDRFASIFSCMDTKTGESLIIDNIVACYEVRLALAKVIGVKTNLSGSSRLVKLYSEESNSIWRCQRSTGSATSTLAGLNSSGSDCSVSLRYTIDDTHGNRIWRQHVANDLIEFQSNLVLERPSVGGNADLGAEGLAQASNENELIETFLMQCGSMRRLSAAFLALHSSGHFNFYPDYLFDVPAASEQAVFQDKVAQLESFLVDWNYHVQNIRSKYYYINYYDLKRCYHLKCLLNDIVACLPLSDAASVEKKETFPGKLARYICFINPAVAVDTVFVNDVARNLLDRWRTSCAEISEASYGEVAMDIGNGAVFVDNPTNTDVTMDVVDDALAAHNESKNELLKLAVILEELLNGVARRIRKVHINDIDKSVVNERLGRGIHIAQGFSLKGVYDQLLTLYAIQGELGEWENVLCCSKNTSFEQASLLIRRWHRSHAHGREGVLYAMVEVNKLSYEVQHACVQLFRELGPSQSAANGPVILITETYENCHLTSQYINNKVTAGILPLHLLKQIGELLRRSGKNGMGLHCYTSSFSGAGKSFKVRSLAASNRLMYSHIPINSNTTPTNILIRRTEENIMRSSHSIPSTPLVLSQHSESVADAGIVLHFDIASTAGSAIISTIFALAVFGVLADSETESTFYYDTSRTVVAIELAAGLQDGAFCQMLMYPQVYCSVTSKSFVIDEQGLRQGMGEEFRAILYSPLSVNVETAVDEDLDRSTAYDRLNYILNCLKVRSDNNGSLPLFETGAWFTQQFEGDRDAAFQLLMEASGQDLNPSLWCVWAFINVLYWQLQQIQHPTSPVNLACVPDTGIQLMTLEYDMKMKARVKGEMVAFLCATAREFATRKNTKPSCDGNRIVGILLKHFSASVDSAKITDINKIFWKREQFDNDGRPVYKSPVMPLVGFNKSKSLYIYYRESENRYVIDDTVNYTGRVIAYSSNDGELTSVRFEKRSVSTYLTIYVSLKVHNKGRANEYLEISGCDKAVFGPGSMLSQEDNGKYYRLPKDQNIDGQPHYFKNDRCPRHVYFVNKNEANMVINRWVIGKTCNVIIMGAQAFSLASAKLEDTEKFGLQYFGPNTYEDKMTIEYVTAAEAPHKLANLASLDALLNGARIRDDAAHVIAAQLETAGLGIELARWNESNHECILFSNTTGNVSFLSQNPETLVKNMHPVLLKHLQTNDICVGEDLRVLSEKHWEILSALTGVRRTREEALSLLDENFCLTGDSLLKILAIVSRCRCKVPVVLLGECGCGKTMLLSFLCKWLGVMLLSLDVHGGTTESEIINVFDKATTILANASSSSPSVFVFLDEVNTCAHMGLLNEAICHRSIYGRRLHDGIQILAALNPYRLRTKKEVMGLTFQLGSNPMVRT